MITVNYRDPTPLYEQIKENVIRLIMTGSLSADDRLPSVRELSVKLAINPNTIARAYRELESEGYIYVTPGRGTFVSPRSDAKADVDDLMESFRRAVAKLVYNGVGTELLKGEIDSVSEEVKKND